ncbi:MAG TPA: FAD-dependent oxidoreductase [Acidimicrobiales bacterium]
MVDGDRGRVVIVGAGLSGLMAASELKRRGFDAVVVEMRDRVGGRCHTVDGVDLGAHWIHGTEGNPVTSVARRLHLPTVFVGGDSTYTGGWEAIALRAPVAVPIAGDDKSASALAADAMWDALDQLRRERLAGGLPDISLADAVNQLRSEGRLPVDATLEWHLEMLAREDAGSGSRALSLTWWDEDLDVYGYGDSVLAAGYGDLAARLADGLDVRLGFRVTEVDLTDPALARVVIDDGTVLLAEAVLVTLPIGVLKAGSVCFNPPLPEHKQSAIDRLGVGVLAKVAFVFDQVWWNEEQYVVGLVAHRVDERPTAIVNLALTHGLPVLVLLAGGELGRWVETADGAAVSEWGLAALADAFGGDVPAPVAMTRTSWSIDEASLGSYSALTVGAGVSDLETLAEPVGGRLFFAGEATSRRGRATAHGALLSGRREAARIAGDPLPPDDAALGETLRLRRQRQRMARFHEAATRQLEPEALANRLAVLRSATVFDEVPARDLEALASMFVERSLADGDVVCRRGDVADEVFVVAAGKLRVQSASGGSAAPVGPGSVVGELGLFGNGRRAATLAAVGDVELLCLDYERFRRFLLAFPEGALAVLGAAISRLTTTGG